MFIYFVPRNLLTTSRSEEELAPHQLTRRKPLFVGKRRGGGSRDAEVERVTCRPYCLLQHRRPPPQG